MPLRDHFHPPLDNKTSWEGFHGQWPAMIVLNLVPKLPARYVAEPRVPLGTYFEIDVASYDEDAPADFPAQSSSANGGVATSDWAPPRPTFEVSADLPDQDQYEVRVYDTKRQRRLVAAVEIVSPTNKDRPEHRRALVAKCATLLQQRVAVSLIDLVTTRQFNLYADLLELIAQSDPSLPSQPPALYAAACRWANAGDGWRFQAWSHPLAIGQPLPTLPLWLADNLAVPLELEATYEETCRILRII